MSPRNRAFLRWAFIIIFLIIAPVIILSTAGYRFNFGTVRLERTGVIIVDTVPTGAHVTLNGRLVKASTPTRITSVSPGSYRVKIEKAGYRTWEKGVAVEEGQTLFLNDIVLLPDTQLTLEHEQSGSTGSVFSPDGRFVAAAVNDRGVATVHVYDLKNSVDYLPYRATATPTLSYGFEWSADSQSLVITKKIRVSSIYLLWKISEPNAATIIAKPAVVADPTVGLPPSADALGSAPSSDGKYLLYWNDLEVRVHDTATLSDELITRISGSIKKAAWYAEDRLIIYATNEGLFAIESGHGGDRVTTQLAPMQDISDFSIAKSGESVLIAGTVGHQHGVFSLKLK